MKVIADLHIHSRYSRAVSPKLNPSVLETWARIKGIGLLGSGDCTHPEWLKEFRDQTEEAEEGFYTLKKEAGKKGLEEIPRFVLSGEIGTIYKKEGRVRKIHHLLLLPDLKTALSFNMRLEKWGANIRSDGRPILGIDSRDLLAMLLDTDERSILIPAHIWTPWFSALGAKSGFDSIEECYGDLAAFIPAVETGLSSNPPMNWALKSLDNYSIISNSDAHSPAKLGREATIFEMPLSYGSLRSALYRKKSKSRADEKQGAFSSGNSEASAILGTIEFFPQEGKYHCDGHRKCFFFVDPEKSGTNYLCPVCGKTLTRGVIGRVTELAGTKINEREPYSENHNYYKDSNRRPYYSTIPLIEIIAELLDRGAASQKVENAYNRLIEKGGTEFSILLDKSERELEALSVPELSGELLAQAVIKMRKGEVSISPGYDGEYGKVRIGL